MYLKDLENIAKHLSNLHDSYVLVDADKAPNNIVSACKYHYIDYQYLIKELVMDNSFGNPSLTPQNATTEDIFHKNYTI